MSKPDYGGKDINQTAKKHTHPKIIERVAELRKDGKSYSEIARILNEEFTNLIKDMRYSGYMQYDVSRICNEQVADKMLKDSSYEQKVKSILDEQPDRLREIMNTTDKLHSYVKKIMDNVEAESEEEMQALLSLLKKSPQFLGILKEIRSQMETANTILKDIKEKEENRMYSDLQVQQKVNKTLRKLVQEGKIEIKAPTEDVVVEVTSEGSSSSTEKKDKDSKESKVKGGEKDAEKRSSTKRKGHKEKES